MNKFVTVLNPANPTLPQHALHQLTIIVEAMLAMTGRVTMLDLSRWAGEGGIDVMGKVSGFFTLYKSFITAKCLF
jgi:hypothetical protein